MFVDYYSILEIQYPSSPDEIKKAYHKLSGKWHPDHNINQDTTQKMIMINEAYVVLKNCEKKARYDAEYLLFRQFENKATNTTQTDQETSTRNNYENNTNHRAASYSQYTSPNYHFHNTKVQDDIREAHKVAKDLVDEFIKQFKASSKQAAKGAWDAMWPYVLMIVVSTIIFSLIHSCQ